MAIKAVSRILPIGVGALRQEMSGFKRMVASATKATEPQARGRRQSFAGPTCCSRSLGNAMS